jgi:hypothetical protein
MFENRIKVLLEKEPALVKESYWTTGIDNLKALDAEFSRIDYFHFSNLNFDPLLLDKMRSSDSIANTKKLTQTRLVKLRIKPDSNLRFVEFRHAEKLLIGTGLLDINIAPDELRNRLSKITQLSSLRILNNIMSRKVIEFKTNNLPYIERIEENYTLLKQRYIYQINTQFIHYSCSEAASKLVKGFFIEHDNDFLAPGNLDRDYTGGGLAEIFTDYFKMRLWRNFVENSLAKNLLKRNNYYSYQSILFGAQAFTPYIRDTSKLPTDTSVIRTDRPFASFQFFGRGKYLIHRRGHHRIKQTIKLGKIGGNDAPMIQRILHRDLTSSIYPNGWGAQIGAPNGRYCFQFEVEHQLMLLSKFHDIWVRQENYEALAENKNTLGKQTALNIYALANLKFGGQLTSGDVGFGWTNKNFIKQDFHHFLKSDRETKLKWYDQILFDVNLRYRYVQHNSMLEGFGYLSTVDYTNAKDISKYTPIYYRLQKDQIYRNVFMAETSISITRNKSTIFYKMNFISKEANIKDMRSPGYFYGTVGLIFSL